MMAHRSLVCTPSGLAVCVCVRAMFSHSSLNFLHPTAYMHSGFTFLCEFLHFSGFMYACLRVLSLHVPPCMCPFLCICVWLQIVARFDVYVCMSMNYVKYNFYLCLAVLCRVFSPLCACLCLSEPLAGLPWFWQIIFRTLWFSKYWDMYITYITETKFLPAQN